MAAQAKKTVAKKAPAKKAITKTTRRKEDMTPKQRASDRMKQEADRLGFNKKPTWNENYAEYVAWRRKNPTKTER